MAHLPIAVPDAARTWALVRERARQWVSAAPATHILLLILLITTLLLRGLDGQVANQVLRDQSTNLVRMTTDAPRVLFLSAFLLDSGNVIFEFAKVLLVLVPLERIVGTSRAVAVFAAGHVGATIVTTVGIWWQVRSGSAARGLVYPVDVGVSYGLMAGAGALVWCFRRRGVFLLAGLLVAFTVARLVAFGTFTDWGHAAALAIGLAAGPLVAPRFRASGPSPVSRAQMRAAALVGAILLVGAACLGVAAVLAARQSGSKSTGSAYRSARVIGRPAGCSTPCDQAVVRESQGSTTVLATIRVPSGTFVHVGDTVRAPFDASRPDAPFTIVPADRASARGLFAAAAATSAAMGLVFVLMARSRRGPRAVRRSTDLLQDIDRA
jgi:hypothetical protein